MTDQNNWTEFMRFVPGFDFLKNLASPAVGAAPAGAASTASTASGAFQQWLAPTMDEGEIQKRIDELKVVQFWLEQNSRALEASIHALEVQKSTLATLKSMQAGMQHMSQTFADSMAHNSAQRTASTFEQEVGAAPPPAASGTAAVQPPKPDADGTAEAAPPMPDVPLMQAQAAQWWTALTEQFQTIASKAMQDIGNNVAAMQQEPFSTRAAAVEPGAEQAVPTAAGDQTSKRAAGTGPKAGARTAAAKTTSKPKSEPK